MRKQLYYADSDRFWKQVEELRIKDGSLPKWVFRFVSIHKTSLSFYSLVSPLCLVNLKNKRPNFERLQFRTEKEAKEYAKMVARSTETFVVNCIKK